MCMCVSFSVVYDSLRLPWPIWGICQVPLSMEFKQEHWSGLPFPSPVYFPNPGIKPGSPALQADSSPSEPKEVTLCEDNRVYSVNSPADEYLGIFLCETVLFLQYSEFVYFLEHLEKEGGTNKFSYFHYLEVLSLMLCQMLKMLVSTTSQALTSLSFLLPYCTCSLQSRFYLQYSSLLQGFVLSGQRKFQLVHFKSSQNTKHFLLWFYWILENSLYIFCAVLKLASWDFHWAAYSIWDFSGHFNSHLPFLWSYFSLLQ